MAAISITMSGIPETRNRIDQELKKTVQDLAALTLQEAIVHTPVKSGNARRNWTSKVTNRGFTVENQVPYIERLEAGASRQAPKGIIGPTITSVKRKTNK
jgi:SOS-response transcriptional repressor LexA